MLSVLIPTINFSNLLLEDLINGRGLVDELFFDLFPKTGDFFGLLPCLFVRLASKFVCDFVLLSFLFGCSSRLDALRVRLYLLRVHVGLRLNEVSNERVGVTLE